MYPRLKLFDFEIYSYNICVMFAFLLAIFVFIKRTKNVFLPEVQDSIIAVMGADIPFIIAGAALHNKISYADSLNALFDSLFINTGIAFLGGFLGGFVGFLILFPVLIGKKVPRTVVMNELVPSIIIGHMIGRMGCLFGGCCYGKPAKWGVLYQAGTPAYAAYGAERLVPVPVMEIVLLLMLLLIVLTVRKKSVTIYLTGYSVIRFFLEFCRGDDRGGHGFLSPAQKICVGILIGTMCMDCMGWHRGRQMEV